MGELPIFSVFRDAYGCGLTLSVDYLGQHRRRDVPGDTSPGNANETMRLMVLEIEESLVTTATFASLRASFDETGD